ncbi:unnamed protein product, partial [Closterium sp. NIES-54]
SVLMHDSPSCRSSSSSEEEIIGGGVWGVDLGVDVEEAHRAACAAGDSTYIDPETGYSVFTAPALLKPGRCCGNKCRHCPFGHYAVRTNAFMSRTNSLTEPMLLAPTKGPVPSSPALALLWDGSLPALLALQVWSPVALAGDRCESRTTVLGPAPSLLPCARPALGRQPASPPRPAVLGPAPSLLPCARPALGRQPASPPRPAGEMISLLLLPSRYGHLSPSQAIGVNLALQCWVLLPPSSPALALLWDGSLPALFALQVVIGIVFESTQKSPGGDRYRYLVQAKLCFLRV